MKRVPHVRLDPQKIGYAILTGVPEGERGIAWHLQSLLGELDGYVNDFSRAISLFEHCEELDVALRHQADNAPTDEAFELMDRMRKPSGWKRIAARDAAMTLYHFRTILDAINGTVGQVPSVCQEFDRARMKTAVRLSNDYFRTATRTRHAVSHSSDMKKNPEARRRNSAAGDYEGGGIKMINSGGTTFNTLIGRELTITREGEFLSLSISEETLFRMQEVLEHTCAALLPAAKALQASRFPTDAGWSEEFWIVREDRSFPRSLRDSPT